MAHGDEGVALAEFEDSTGRIWWFVRMKNNISKPLSDYFYLNAEGEKILAAKMGTKTTLDRPIFGWLSSRYVEVIEQ